MKNPRTAEGFTLVELIIVIAIIGVLSAIVIGALNGARVKAKSAKAKQDQRKLQDVMQIAAGDSGRALGAITPSNASGTDNWTGQNCVSYTAGPLRQLKNSTGSCYTDWVAAVDAIVAAASTSLPVKATSFYRDPWGSPYYLDENENTTFPCNIFDAFVSAGPDGYLNDPINPSYPASTDDIKYQVTPSYTGC
jgi:prepilin-type N-terminal cleavage/methylation domain-containing protein